MQTKESPRKRHQRLAREAAKRMASKPCTRTRNCLFEHLKEGLK